MAQRSRKKKAVATRDFPKALRKAPVAAPALSRFSREWLWGLVLLLAVVLTYSSLWQAGFVWDDHNYITDNFQLRKLSGLQKIWTTSAADISPLTFTTFWVEYALWGLNPLPYHLTNVALHGASAVLLWRVLSNLRVPGAWLGAALWALHPVEVESVAWITETKNTQSAFFFLLSILFFVNRVRDHDGRTGGGWNYGASLFFAALAMASKTSTAILPVVLCLCAWWIEGRWDWRNPVRVVPMFLMSIAAGSLTIWTQKLQLAVVTDHHWVRTWPQRLVTAGDAIWFYPGKLLWPHPLIAVYPLREVDASQWFSYLPLLAVIIGFFVLWLNRDSWARAWFFVCAYFLTALLPILGLVDNPIFRYSAVFDHFQYLASMGPLALAGAGLARWADFAIPGRFRLQSSLGAGLLLILGMLSWHRARIYESEEKFWADTVAKNPNCWVGHSNLGLALMQSGRVDEALGQFQKALEIYPGSAQAHCNLGLAFFNRGQLEAAIGEYREALKIYPDYAEAQSNLGLALTQNGQVDEALLHLKKSLAICPDVPETMVNLGIAISQNGQVDEGIKAFQKALEINPNDAEARNDLGIAFAEKGQVAEAVAQFQEALHLQPGFVKAQNNLAKAQEMARQAAGSK